MSTQAITAVTKGVRDLLISQLPAGRKVTLLPPGEDPPTDGSGVNLYLYRAGESPFLRNIAYPGDREGEGALAQPVLSLDLFYLLTPFGPQPLPDDLEDESHRALGEAMLVLYENPVLNDVHLPGFDADAALPDFLLDSYEDVKVRLHPISIEELSRIWSTIGKPYRLSVAYEVSLVQVTPQQAATAAAAAVQRTAVDVVAISAPRLTSLDPTSGAVAQLAAGAVLPGALTLSGFGFTLAGRSPTVTVGSVVAEIEGPVTDRRLSVTLPSSLAGGPDLSVCVELAGQTSAPFTFHATPWISSLTPLRSALDPAAPGDAALTIGGEGFVTATGVRIQGGPISMTLEPLMAGSGPNVAITAAPAAAETNAAPGSDVPNGIYEVRVILADDSLTNPSSLEVIPLVNGFGGGPAESTYAPATGVLSLRGARLDGIDVRMTVDGVEYVLGANVNGQQLSYTFSRAPGSGSHSISLNVDGHVSRPVTLVV